MKSKDQCFQPEREELIQELLQIIKLQDSEFNSSVKTITLHQLDQDEVAVAVKALLVKVRKIYTVTNNSLIYPVKTKRLHLSIIKFLLKDTYNITGKTVVEGSTRTIRYYFYPCE